MTHETRTDQERRDEAMSKDVRAWLVKHRDWWCDEYDNSIPDVDIGAHEQFCRFAEAVEHFDAMERIVAAKDAEILRLRGKIEEIQAVSDDPKRTPDSRLMAVYRHCVFSLDASDDNGEGEGRNL